MHESSRQDLEFPEAPGLRKPIIVETDGGMVPIVEPSKEGKDKRKGKTLSWREAKLSLAHAQGSCTPVYAGSIEGGVEEAGRQLLSCAVRAGFGANSRVHAVGDGAPWIVGQIEQQFGDQGCYLIDFYHVCEYGGAADGAGERRRSQFLSGAPCRSLRRRSLSLSFQEYFCVLAPPHESRHPGFAAAPRLPTAESNAKGSPRGEPDEIFEGIEKCNKRQNRPQ